MLPVKGWVQHVDELNSSGILPMSFISSNTTNRAGATLEHAAMDLIFLQIQMLCTQEQSSLRGSEGSGDCAIDTDFCLTAFYPKELGFLFFGSCSHYPIFIEHLRCTRHCARHQGHSCA